MISSCFFVYILFLLRYNIGVVYVSGSKPNINEYIDGIIDTTGNVDSQKMKKLWAPNALAELGDIASQR